MRVGFGTCKQWTPSFYKGLYIFGYTSRSEWDTTCTGILAGNDCKCHYVMYSKYWLGFNEITQQDMNIIGALAENGACS